MSEELLPAGFRRGGIRSNSKGTLETVWRTNSLMNQENPAAIILSLGRDTTHIAVCAWDRHNFDVVLCSGLLQQSLLSVSPEGCWASGEVIDCAIPPSVSKNPVDGFVDTVRSLNGGPGLVPVSSFDIAIGSGPDGYLNRIRLIFDASPVDGGDAQVRARELKGMHPNVTRIEGFRAVLQHKLWVVRP